MGDERIEKLARLCVQYSADVKPREKVVIRGSALAYPLIKEIYKECLLSDAYPSIMPNLDVQYIFYRYAKDHQLKFVSPVESFIVENTDALIGVWCQPNLKELTNIDPARIKMQRASRKRIMDTFFKRSAEGKLKWVDLLYPIDAQAQEAGMSIEEYEDFVYSSCLADKEDPIAEWKKINEEQQRICNFLNQVEQIQIIGEDTDLTLSVKGRKWINCSGKYNMPDGEVFTGPIENSANGTIRFTFPGIYLDREVEDIKLTFKDGKVAKASAVKGNELLQQILRIEGAAQIGEVAIGTNYRISRFTKNMLFDEKMGGTIHVALGASIQQSGGLNRSAIHWDILKDMNEGEIHGDNKLFYKNGKLLL